MWPMIVRFFSDETAFVGYSRAILLAFAGVVTFYPDAVVGMPKWLGVLAMAAAGMIRAGEPNPRPGAGK